MCKQTLESNISSFGPFYGWKNNSGQLFSFLPPSHGELLAGGTAAAGAGQLGGAHLHCLSHTWRRVRHLYSGSRVSGAAT